MKDLFGNEITIDEAWAIEAAGKKKRRYNHKARGYAGTPGRGPEGETCKTCSLLCYQQTRRGKRFYKCGLIKPTCGPGTDIRLKSPACQFWKPKTEAPK